MGKRRLRDGDELRSRQEPVEKYVKGKKEEEASFSASRFAKITRLATDVSESEQSTKSKLESVDASLLDRIQKMLKLAQHPNTSEAEARQALRASTRMLSAYNLTEADLMAHESASEQLQRAGHSVVTVRHREGKAVSLEQWSVTLGHAINVAFNVKYFHTRYSAHDRVEFTFYGLRDNTVAAVVSFEAVFNLALAWAANRTDVKGRTGKNLYLIGLSESLYRMAKKEKKQEEQQAIQAERRRCEIEERQAKDQERIVKGRLQEIKVEAKATQIEDEEDEEDIVFVKFKAGPKKAGSTIKVKNEPGELDSEDDEGDDDVAFIDAIGQTDGGEEDIQDDLGDIDAERRRFESIFETRSREGRTALQERTANTVKTESQLGEEDVKPKREPKVEQWSDLNFEASYPDPGPVKEEPDEHVPTWESAAQLTLFKETAARVADEYLKEGIKQKIKVSKAKARATMHDAYAYRQGEEDARKVDLKRRRLEQGNG